MSLLSFCCHLLCVLAVDAILVVVNRGVNRWIFSSIFMSLIPTLIFEDTYYSSRRLEGDGKPHEEGDVHVAQDGKRRAKISQVIKITSSPGILRKHKCSDRACTCNVCVRDVSRALSTRRRRTKETKATSSSGSGCSPASTKIRPSVPHQLPCLRHGLSCIPAFVCICCLQRDISHQASRT